MCVCDFTARDDQEIILFHCGFNGGVTTMLEAWLVCRIDEGMFPGELGISFRDISNRDVSLYCSERFVDKDKSALRVTVLEKSGNWARLRLPDQSFNGTTVVDVAAEDLQEVLQVA
jgi:hypothetical protein